MPVSVVIATTLRRAVASQSVRQAIESVRAAGPDAEVVLIVNGAPPDARPAVRAPELRVLHSPTPGISTARNLGAAAARHDTVLFTDDDVLVPPDWAPRMAAALAGGEHVAVAAPVRMVVDGPVTAFMEHERAFDALPLTADRARTLVTANAGYRRDLAPDGPPFDEERHQWAGEDTEFGLRLRAAGGTIRWLADAPVLHVVPDDAAQLVRRAIVAGQGCARIRERYDDLSYYLPSAPQLYESMVDGAPTAWRRCPEIADPAVRHAFATLGVVRQCGMLAGYLRTAGERFGLSIVDLDAAGLAEALGAVFTASPQSPEPADGWPAVPVRFGAPVAAGDPEPPFQAVAAALRRFAPLRPVPWPVQARIGQEDLAWLSRRASRDAVFGRRLAGVDPATWTVPALESLARSVGFTLPEACGYVERAAVAQAPTRLRRWPGAVPPKVGALR